MGKVLINDTTLTAIGNAIRSKNETTNTYKPSQMPDAIMNLSTGIPLPFEITGNAYNLFSYNDGGFNAKYPIVTRDLTNIDRMFAYNDDFTVIPYEINTGDSWDGKAIYVFCGCSHLTEVPKINTTVPVKSLEDMLCNCSRLRQLPEGFESWFIWDTNTIETKTFYDTFKACYSLRSIPVEIFNHDYIPSSSSYSYLNGLNSLYALDELTNLPMPFESDKTYKWGVLSSNCFRYLSRLKNLTFEFEPNKTINLTGSSAYLDLTYYVGYAQSEGDILNYNSGCTAETRIVDDETYNSLKDHPDAWTTDIAYSRYNHDSAVATINSLPNVSNDAHSANMLKFKGASGSATNGGAIESLTEEEIAVATAKGWTVSIS